MTPLYTSCVYISAISKLVQRTAQGGVLLMSLVTLNALSGNAQNTESTEAKPVATQTESSTAIKARSAANVNNNGATQTAGTNASAVSNVSVAATPAFDYSLLPHDVQQQLDANKLAGKELFDGVLKAFTAEVPGCQQPADVEPQLGFITHVDGVKRVEFVSPGLVYIVVKPNVDTDPLEDAMANAGLKYNLLNRFYLLGQ